MKHYRPRSVNDYELRTFVVSYSILTECAFMSEAAWRSLPYTYVC